MKSMTLCSVLFLSAGILLFSGCQSAESVRKAEQKAALNRRLFLCIGYNGDSRMRLALERGADPNAVNDVGIPILSAAAVAGREDLVKLLLEFKADPEKTDRDGERAIHAAAIGANGKVLSMILAVSKDPDRRGYRGRTPLMLACIAGRLENVKILLAAGADMTLRDSRGASVVYYTACSRTKPLTPAPDVGNALKDEPIVENDAVRILDIFEQKGLDKKYFTDATSSVSPLLAAIRLKNDPVVLYLFSWQDGFGYGSGRESLGRDLAEVAIDCDNLPAIRALTAKHLYLNQDRLLPMKIMRFLNMEGVYKLMARYWLLPRRMTPLHYACTSGKAAIAEYLVLAGSDPNVVSNEEKNAYDYANDTRTYEAVKKAEKSRF